MIINILYEDNHLIALQKPAGIPSQSDETGDRSLQDAVQDYLKLAYSKPGEAYLALLHRIDRPVTGIVIFAKTSKAASRMSIMFRDREIQKTYLTIVQKAPKEQELVLEDYIWKNNNENRSYCFAKEKKGSKKAELSYKHLLSKENFHLLEVKPVTGRPHQIRAQLSNIGCEILGDVKYGNRFPLRDKSICLLAFRLEFIHPVKKEPIVITAELPDNKFWNRFKKEIQNIYSLQVK